MDDTVILTAARDEYLTKLNLCHPLLQRVWQGDQLRKDQDHCY